MEEPAPEDETAGIPRGWGWLAWLLWVLFALLTIGLVLLVLV